MNNLIEAINRLKNKAIYLAVAMQQDVYIVNISNGIAVFVETEYEEILSKNIEELKIAILQAEPDTTQEELDSQIDLYCQKIIIEYIDYKKLNQKEIDVSCN